MTPMSPERFSIDYVMTVELKQVPFYQSNTYMCIMSQTSKYRKTNISLIFTMYFKRHGRQVCYHLKPLADNLRQLCCLEWYHKQETTLFWSQGKLIKLECLLAVTQEQRFYILQGCQKLTSMQYFWIKKDKNCIIMIKGDNVIVTTIVKKCFIILKNFWLSIRNRALKFGTLVWI